ncbi:MAG TPA: hypothetical protein VM600_09470 [Actinomycetota bacterium]|nr:hypothetical protein [Actinomycetota bacterium]
MEQRRTSVEATVEPWTPTRELRQSLLLLALTISSMGVYLGIAAAAVRLVSVVR